MYCSCTTDYTRLSLYIVKHVLTIVCYKTTPAIRLSIALIASSAAAVTAAAVIKQVIGRYKLVLDAE